MSPREKEMVDKLKGLGVKPHYPNSTLYKYCSIDDAIKILTGGTLLFQTPHHFNDPFEMHMGLLDFKQAAVDRFWKTAPQKYTTEEIDILMKNTTDETWISIAHNLIEQDRATTGILCLSKTNLSTLMWSHYAQKHTGICLGFKVRNGAHHPGTVAFQVKYTTSVDPQKFSLGDGIDDIVAFTHWVCTKSHIWEYEKEVRVISLNQNGLLPFNKYQLCEIYFGANTSQADINLINNIIRHYGYRLFRIGKMLVDNNTFDLKRVHYLPIVKHFRLIPTTVSL